MTQALIAAALRLADRLTAENAALAALDLSAAAALLADKQRAVQDLVAMQTATTGATLPQDLAINLRKLAEENRRLLERAIAVQGEVVSLVAGAIRQVAAPAGYVAAGTPTTDRRAIPFALSAHA